MTTDLQPLPPRGGFPKGPATETLAEQRKRYEQFVLSTHSRLPDYEKQSIEFYRDKTKLVTVALGATDKKEVPAAPSRRICTHSRCWQCEAGDDDPSAHLRIANCKVASCGLWPVRPYQEFAQPPVPPKAGPGNFIGAIRTHCLQCMGGKDGPERPRHFLPEVTQCRSVTCALWVARPTSSAAPAGETGRAALEATDE